eukprot:353947_1
MTTKDVQPDFKDEPPMNRKNSGKKRSRSDVTTSETEHPPNKRTRYDTIKTTTSTKISIENHNNLNHTHENKENQNNNTITNPTTPNSNTNTSNPLLNRVPKKKNTINIQLHQDNTNTQTIQNTDTINPTNTHISIPKTNS